MNTGYQRFTHTSGVQGLAKVTGKRLDLLAVVSSHPGAGEFRAFIADAKKHFDVIAIWEIWEPLLDGILQRYGFTRTTLTEDGETTTGRLWTNPQQP